MSITDNNGFTIAPLVVAAVNNHDSVLFNESFFNLMDTADLFDFDLKNSFLTLDSGFDSLANKITVRYFNLIPVIKPNPRGIKDKKKLELLNKDFLFDVYKKRYKVERSFAWQDTYRKLVIRYEKLQCTHLGFKYLAYSMMNFRVFFNRD